MELIGALNVLWTRRRLVGLGAGVALAIGILLLHSGGSGAAAGTTAVASARLLLDTPRSQLVDVSPMSAETLAKRAELFADLMAAQSVRRNIAAHAGLRAGQLDVFGPSTRGERSVATPLVVESSTRGETPRASNVIRSYADGLVPLISIEAIAPDARGAKRLIRAAEEALRSEVGQTGAEGRQGFELARIASREPVVSVAKSHERLFAAAGSAVVFVLWCAAIVLAAGVAARRRVSSAQPV